MGSAQSSTPPANNAISPAQDKEHSPEENNHDPESPPSPDDPVKHVLVIGPTGSGKTAFIKLVTGVDIELGHDTGTGTSDLRTYCATFDDQTFTFIDTPGFSEQCDDNRLVVVKICHWLSDNILARQKAIHGILCLQDISSQKTTLAMQCSVEFLQALLGQNHLGNVAFVTTKWDLLNQSKLSKFELKHNHWGTMAAWRQIVADGEFLFRHYGITDTPDDNEDDVERAQQSKQRILSRLREFRPMRLQMVREFRYRDEGSTAEWLANSMPSLGQYGLHNINREGAHTQGELCQEVKSEGFSTVAQIVTAVAALAGGAYAYQHRDSIKRTVRDAHRRLEHKTRGDWSFNPWIEPDGKGGTTIGIGGRYNMR